MSTKKINLNEIINNDFEKYKNNLDMSIDEITKELIKNNTVKNELINKNIFSIENDLLNIIHLLIDELNDKP
jgi:hypothetical protein